MHKLTKHRASSHTPVDSLAGAQAVAALDSTVGILMDMSIQLKTASGAICTLSLSFNNEGPLGT
jgi:hypothetical protein